MAEITSRDYDERIVAQGEQFQIDNYYKPKDITMRRRVETVARALGAKKNDRVLDIGCGAGTFAYHSASAGAFAVGIDYSLESAKIASALCAKFGCGRNACFLVADASALPFKAGIFDKAVAADFIEHITDEGKKKFLKEMDRTLKGGGIAAVFTPNGIREKIGEWYWRARSAFFGQKPPSTELHFGLTTRRAFERMCREASFTVDAHYEDTTRPYLARIPVIRRFLALNLLWILRKAGS